MKTIKIAPDLSEITLNKNIVSTDFNGLHIEYIMPAKEYLSHNPGEVKKALQTAIALSSKTWQIMDAMNGYFKWNGRLKVELINK